MFTLTSHRFRIPVFCHALLLALACTSGCYQKTPEEIVNSTEKVLRQIETGEPTRAESSPNEKPANAVEPMVDTPNRTDMEKGSITAQLPDPSGLFQQNKQTETVPPSATSPVVTADDPSDPWITADQLPRDVWEVQYIGNSPVGFVHRHVEVSRTQGKKSFRLTGNSVIRISSKGNVSIQRLQFSSIEQDNGDLISLEGSVTHGDTKNTFKATVLSGLMRLTSNINGSVTQTNVPWKDDYRGPFAVEQSLIRRPMGENESRKLKYFDPIMGKMVDVLVESKEYVMSPTLVGGSRELLVIRNTGLSGTSGLEAQMWVDKKGEGFKSYIPYADIRSFRTSAVEAQTIESLFELQELVQRSVPLLGSLQPFQASQPLLSCTYRVSLQSKDPFQIFSDRTNQRIRSIDAKTAEITVFATNPNADDTTNASTEKNSIAENLQSSSLLPATDPLVLKFARALVVSDKTLRFDEASVSEKVAAIRTQLFKRFPLKPFDNQVEQTAKVMRVMKANCVEHAILFATTCRALKIPARLAFGYRFNRSEQDPSMEFHAWIEYFDRKWIPMDSTQNTAADLVDRLKVSESSITDANPYDDFLNVIRIMPELEIKVLTQ